MSYNSKYFERKPDSLEEAILNAMLAAETLTGINGYTVPALPHDRLAEIVQRMFGGFRDLR